MSSTRALGSIIRFCLFSLLTLWTQPSWGQQPVPPVLTEERVMMGTQVIIKVIDPDQEKAKKAIEAAFQEIHRLELLMSNFIPSTPLSQINQQAGKSPVSVGPELFHIVERSVEFSKMSDGAFDISFASVGKLWNFRQGVLPSPDAIKNQLPFVDYSQIKLDEESWSVYLPHSEMEIGLGGIGKGYAVDRAMEVLSSFGIQNAMAMAGGDMLVRGRKGDEPWQVGLRDPDDEKKILAVLPLENQAISTSGDYERFFIKDGVRYHHILDPETGYPARLCRSVSILASAATTSDALTKPVFILGPERGMALVERLEGVEAIIVDSTGKIWLSSGLQSLGDLQTSPEKAEEEEVE